MKCFLRLCLLPAILLMGTLGYGFANAQDPTPRSTGAVAPPTKTKVEKAEPKAKAAIAAHKKEQLKRLSKADKVWIDTKNKAVVVEGEVVLTKGQLEMFACPQNTKEHESVVAVESKAFVVHTALLAVGAKSGHPAQFTPVYLIPTGDVIDVYVVWDDADGKQQMVRAQEMVRNIKSQQAMKHDWVFGGSGFWVDETSNEQHYLGEGGELICVSNFPSATIDVQVKSSQGNDSLLFEAFTENIPPRETKVTLVLVPQIKKKAETKQQPMPEEKKDSAATVEQAPMM